MQNGQTVTTRASATWSQWPETFKALAETYFTARTFGSPGEIPANGNYLLAGLQRYSDVVRASHAHHGFSQATLDGCAAHEVFYLWNRGRKFIRPAAGISACICNIALERPERMLERQTRMSKREQRTEQRKESSPMRIDAILKTDSHVTPL